VRSVLDDKEKRQALNERMNDALSVIKDPWKTITEDEKVRKELFETVVMS
jgi:nitrite reductase (NADH) large subunit